MTKAVALGSAGEVGWRFRPTDQELVCYYLQLKRLGFNEEVERIPEKDFCAHEPWQLPKYFFCRPVYKYPNSSMLNRATKQGSWNVTGRDCEIQARGSKEVIGIRKTLVFYENNKPKRTRTNWIIYEYHSKATHDPNQEEFMVCRLKYKGDHTTDTSSSNERERNYLRNLEDNLFDEAEDIKMGEANNQLLADISSDLLSVIYDPNQSPFDISDELLRQMIKTPASERLQMLVKSLAIDQDAAFSRN